MSLVKYLRTFVLHRSHVASPPTGQKKQKNVSFCLQQNHNLLSCNTTILTTQRKRSTSCRRSAKHSPTPACRSPELDCNDRAGFSSRTQRLSNLGRGHVRINVRQTQTSTAQQGRAQSRYRPNIGQRVSDVNNRLTSHNRYRACSVILAVCVLVVPGKTDHDPIRQDEPDPLSATFHTNITVLPSVRQHCSQRSQHRCLNVAWRLGQRMPPSSLELGIVLLTG